ncbi:TraB/GumN family protein [Alteraurantiacibacter aestuarii]|uniref:TraB/GumN family protein n=1 Tax=Alteraurantiacibacter aestuarii TaxID=650004 RepID=UPI0031DDFE4C
MSDEDTTIYLFGTVHILPPQLEWMDARITAAFEASDELVTEVDMTEMQEAAQRTLVLAQLPEGQSLRGLMTDDDRAEYEAALTGMGLPVAALDGFEPWFATVNLGLLPALRAGYNPESGVDLALTSMAGGKRTTGLETIEFQLGLFDSMPMDQQLTALDRAVEQMPNALETIDTMVGNWMSADTVALAEIINAEFSDPDAYDWFIGNRNRNWAQWIDDRLDQPGTVFIAVGAGHLAGRDSVQDLLAARGIATVLED